MTTHDDDEATERMFVFEDNPAADGLLRRRPEPGHRCQPPHPAGTFDDYVWPDPDEMPRQPPQLREGVRLPVAGDVYECSCGRNWLLRDNPQRNDPGVIYAAPQWTRESPVVHDWQTRHWRNLALYAVIATGCVLAAFAAVWYGYHYEGTL